MCFLSRHFCFHSNLDEDSSVDANIGVGQGELPSIAAVAGALCVEAAVSMLDADMDTFVRISIKIDLLSIMKQSNIHWRIRQLDLYIVITKPT